MVTSAGEMHANSIPHVPYLCVDFMEGGVSVPRAEN